MTSIARFLPRTRIAYFSMEIAMLPEMHTYSGGLGVLAGDTVRSCADLSLPVVFLTLASRDGYLRQRLSADGDQIAEADPWDPSDWCQPLDAIIGLPIADRKVWVRPWLYLYRNGQGSEVPVLLLDTQIDMNDPDDRGITDRLYGGDNEYRLLQEIVLGVGGLRILEALGFKIETYHMNEGHAALLAGTLLCRFPHPEGHTETTGLRFDADRVRERCVFTTHTPVEAGHDKFDYALSRSLMHRLLPIDQLRLLAGSDHLNMTRLALSLSNYVNGVAERHAETAQRMYPEKRIREVTNGIHVDSWVHPAKAALFDKVAPHWRHEPQDLVNADLIPDQALADAHAGAKRELLDEIAKRSGKKLDPDLPLLAFARRMTGYKRPDLIFTDIEQLREIARARPFQLLMAGKAHPADEPGKALIRKIYAHMAELGTDIPMVFLPDYDLALARSFVAGADVWLNTPLPPYEASGTSGMKAAVNGVLNLSVLDGWWLEGWTEGVTGWAIGTDGEDPNQHSTDLYDKLRRVVMPLYHNDRDAWLKMMRGSIAKIGTRFNSQLMMRRYASEAYLR